MSGDSNEVEASATRNLTRTASATSTRTELRQWRPFGAREPDGLARAGAEGEGDVPPGVEKGRRGRQMEDDAAHRTDDMDAELEQSLTQRGHLRAGAGRARRSQPEFL